MCKLFENYREELISLVYKLEEFSEKGITQEFLRGKRSDVIIGEMLTVKEYLLSLCELGVLSYDGITFKVVPEDQQINHQLFVCALS
ncbi:hypothetical protein [Bacillus sp. ISL-77]|uniref:hypothetical protein n=1 Tax=Bacillus sp. ISL-77 TaxID=2819138 RepID=UPI001BE975F9|nr:hypothetical protein [Bacillus sp. ISL-77]MBT2740722.1 hypothetical protein [Bacillus sp. ISL-77]